MDQAYLKRKMVAVLLADVVGYSRLTELDEEGTHLRLSRIKEEVIDLSGQRHGGRFIRTMGDGMLVEFDSAIDAVRFAIEIQEELTRSEGSVEPELRIRLRIGVSIGDVIFDESDIYGHTSMSRHAWSSWPSPAQSM